jgi:hypothetical protein
VACCYVEITGKDGKKHILTTDAASAYGARKKAIEAWSRLWWWDIRPKIGGDGQRRRAFNEHGREQQISPPVDA